MPRPTLQRWAVNRDRWKIRLSPNYLIAIFCLVSVSQLATSLTQMCMQKSYAHICVH
jgi:hypothetical protein